MVSELVGYGGRVRRIVDQQHADGTEALEMRTARWSPVVIDGNVVSAGADSRRIEGLGEEEDIIYGQLRHGADQIRACIIGLPQVFQPIESVVHGFAGNYAEWLKQGLQDQHVLANGLS